MTRKQLQLSTLFVLGGLMGATAWAQCDVQNPDPDCPVRPVVLLRDALATNPNAALFACARDDDFCVGLLLSNQEGVSSQALFVNGQPQGVIGSHAYIRLVDAPGVLCACPGGSGEDQDACARSCLVGFITGIPDESERAACGACGRLMLVVHAREDVAVDEDDDPATPPVIEPLAYIGVGQTGLVRAIDTFGDACSATLVIDETIPPSDFSFTFENNSHGAVTSGCL